MTNLKLQVLALFFGINAYALGPIPNGTYQGTQTCGGEAAPSTLIITDSGFSDGQQENAMVADANGYFSLNSVSGFNETGYGHFTADGLHFEAVCDLPDPKTGKPAPAHGWDTFTYKDGKLYLDSAVSVPKGPVVPCTGIWTQTP